MTEWRCGRFCEISDEGPVGDQASPSSQLLLGHVDVNVRECVDVQSDGSRPMDMVVSFVPKAKLETFSSQDLAASTCPFNGSYWANVKSSSSALTNAVPSSSFLVLLNYAD